MKNSAMFTFCPSIAGAANDLGQLRSQIDSSLPRAGKGAPKEVREALRALRQTIEKGEDAFRPGHTRQPEELVELASEITEIATRFSLRSRSEKVFRAIRSIAVNLIETASWLLMAREQEAAQQRLGLQLREEVQEAASAITLYDLFLDPSAEYHGEQSAA